jgi:hypothetical protein
VYVCAWTFGGMCRNVELSETLLFSLHVEGGGLNAHARNTLPPWSCIASRTLP